ncbi:uracil-DNA glycosylase [Alphaproteobacteria bacterium]|nr:uracil-DNA glycosylase [Alphaproteobacteria bacterium]
MTLPPEKQGLWLLAQDFAAGPVLSEAPVNHMIEKKNPPAEIVTVEPTSPPKPSSMMERMRGSQPMSAAPPKTDLPPARAPATPIAVSPATAPVTMDLSHITSLEDLRNVVHQFEDCTLKKTAMNTVFSDGNPNANVMVIGEAPGADEDRQGKPFVGMSGQLLDKFFKTIGLNRQENLYITNVIPWRPPGNRPPTPFEISQCLPFLHHHIRLAKPEMIVLVGGTSAKALLGPKTAITKLRGTWTSLTIPGVDAPIPTMPLYHPAYLLRSPGNKAKVWQDLLTLQERL